jgi:MSHA biogenesis protein MshE
VATALNAVLAQRLIRRVCESCREPHVPEPSQLVWLEKLHGAPLTGHGFQHGSGCHQCHNTGYSGRLGVFELLEMNEAMISSLRRDDPQGFADAALASPHYRPLAMCALDYALAGLTSVEEVLKVCVTRTDEVLI